MRHRLILDGDIKEYYDDFVDNTGYHQCTGCKGKADHWRHIDHARGCPNLSKWKRLAKRQQKNEVVRRRALAKLTTVEKRLLGVS